MIQSGRIELAVAEDREAILALYTSQKGTEYCFWTDTYPDMETIDFDLSRDALFVMRDEEDKVIAAISMDQDEEVIALTCWDPDLQPSCELARVAVDKYYQNRGIARSMMQFCFEKLRQKGMQSAHFLVNRYNQKALRSYAKLDCALVGTCHLYGQDFLCFEKKL